MKTILLGVLMLGASSIFAKSSQDNLTCYMPDTAAKRLEIVVSDRNIQEVTYLGPYHINGPEKMVKIDKKFQISKGNDFMSFQRLKLTHNRFGIFLSAYQDIELLKRGASFDRHVTFICE